MTMAGGFGLDVDLSKVPAENALRGDVLLFSESAGRFLVTVSPENRDRFESLMSGKAFGRIGIVTESPNLRLTGPGGRRLAELPLPALRAAWKRPFGDLV